MSKSIHNRTFSSSRTECPSCKASRGFAAYKDADGGYCHSCGYSSNDGSKSSTKKSQKKKAYQCLNPDLLHKLKEFEKSNFADYFGKIFGSSFVEHCKNNFNIHSDSYGATIFPYFDSDGNLRNLKSMPYLDNGHRDKDGFKVLIYDKETVFPAVFGFRKSRNNGYDVLEFLSQKKGFTTCLFGEYFLNPDHNLIIDNEIVKTDIDTPVILLESEKSVVIASFHYPDFIFIATGGTNGLTKEKAPVVSLQNKLDNSSQKLIDSYSIVKYTQYIN